MRIIGGYLRGKKIFEPLDLETRPLKDLVKESIFNILGHSKENNVDLDGAKILDLFSGTGSFGLECLSRGADNVIFFENYDNSIKILFKNIKNLDLEKKTKIFNKNVIKLENFLKNDQVFDLIFIDPPFRNNDLNELIDKISKLKIFHQKTVVIIHRSKKTKEEINSKFKISKEKAFGLSKILFGKII